MLRKYEGMFLFDPTVTAEWESVQAELGRLMDRAGAQMVASAKWDDCRLAYEIAGRKRGIYALAYFKAEASKIADLERDAQLSEAVLRCLIMRADHLTEEEMKEAAAQPIHEPSPGDDHGGRLPTDARAKSASRGEASVASLDSQRQDVPVTGPDDAQADSSDENADAAQAADADKAED